MSPNLLETSRVAPTSDDASGTERSTLFFCAALTAVVAAALAGVLLLAPGAAPASAPWIVPAALALILLLAGTGAFAAGTVGGPARRRTLRLLGALLAGGGAVLIVVAVALRLFVPLPLQEVLVQFSDLDGRVQIEYCPTLPQSFAGSATAEALQGSRSVVPVKISGDVCGSSEFTDGVWLYLARSSITVGTAG